MEESNVLERYAKRVDSDRYNFRNPSFFLSEQEKESILHSWLREVNPSSLLEIGCGTGKDLQKFIKLGFRPFQLTGNELIQSRLDACKQNVPADVKLIYGSALELEGQYDIVYQSTVFSSVLDDGFQQQLANKMWNMAEHGVLWYDFIYNNPRNKDVRGIPLDRVKQLFPEGRIKTWKLTLAPPISRLVTKIHPNMYHVFNRIPLLRTHILCWIEKP